MENDPLAMLAPPDPTWNPGNTVPPDAMVAAPAAAAAAPAAPQPMAQVDPVYPTSIPSETAPNNPDIERSYHESTWRRILDKVGGILGGDTTIHVTKDKDGNVTMTHDPSTTGEKWSRIAATALGGAARGVANSQGPGGAFKGAAAGTEYGLQANKERQQDADAQATAEQKRQQMNANGALIHQQLYTSTLQARALNTKLTQDQASMLNEYKDSLAASPNSKDYGTIASEADLMKVASENQAFLQQHTNLQLKAVPVPDGKGGIALHAIATDPGDDMQPSQKGDYLFNLDADPKTGKPILSKEPVSAGSRKAGELRLANQKKLAEFFDAQNKYQKNLNDTDKANKDHFPKTAAEAIAQAALTTDTDERQRLTAAAVKMQDSEESLRRAGRSTTNVALTPESSNNWGTLLSDPSSGVTLANVPPKQRDQVINAMAAAGQKMAKPLTGAELTRADLAGNAIHNIEEAQAILKRRPDMFGPAGYGKSKFQELLAGGDPDAMAYKTAIDTANLPTLGIHGMKGKYALQDLAKLDSNLYINAKAMENILGEIHRSASEFRYTGGRETKPADTPSGNTSQAARQKEPPAQAFKPAASQPPNPPFAGAVFGTGAQGTGWYPPSAGGTK